MRSCDRSPGATVLVSTIPQWVPPPVPLPASGERVQDGRWIGLLAQLQGLPVVSPRPKSLSSITLKCTDNYTQKMCSDSSGNQHIQCTGMKPLRLSNQTNKQNQRTVSSTLKHTRLCSGPADLFLEFHLFKCLALRRVTNSYWAVCRSWCNGIPDLAGPLSTTGAVIVMLLFKDKDKTQAHSHIMVNWIYFLLENNSSNLQVQTAE